MAMPKYVWVASIKPLYRLVSLACKSIFVCVASIKPVYRLVSLACKSFSCDSTEPQGFSARVNVNLGIAPQVGSAVCGMPWHVAKSLFL